MSNKILRDIIMASGGKAMTITFRKADGTMRKMNCRTGVTKHLRGGESTTAHKKNLVTVWDFQKKAYRCINLDTVTKISAGGRKFTVEDESNDESEL